MDDIGQNENQTPIEPAQQAGPFVIVVGNEKGGAGKTTVSMHLIAALLNAGKRVGAIDLDIRQSSLGNYIDHRRRWVGRRRQLGTKATDHSTPSRTRSKGCIEPQPRIATELPTDCCETWPASTMVVHMRATIGMVCVIPAAPLPSTRIPELLVPFN